jgi:hypothetical protein
MAYTPPQQPTYQQGPTPWPAAPEAAPMFKPPASGSFPALPGTEMPWPGTPTPFSVASPAPAPVASMFGLAEQPWQPVEPTPLPPSRPAPLNYAAMREAPPIDADSLETWHGPGQRSNVWPALLFILLVVGGCLWVLRDDLLPPMVVEIPVAKPAPAVTRMPAVASDPVIPTPAPLPPMEPEIRRAEIPKPKVDLVAAGESAQKLLLDLIESTTPEARAALIAMPEEYGADVEEFFAVGKPELMSFKPSNATPLTLPGQDAVPLFQVTTKANQHGALLRLVPQKKGGFLLDWPLFAETHERRLGDFLEKKPTEPAWFHVGLRRSHALELPEAVRGIQIAFTLQGAADSSVSCLAITQKDTPIGRYLNREAEWSTIYVARLLLQHRQLSDGTPAVVILDCEGAATAEQ